MSMFHQNAPRPPVVPGEETEGVVTNFLNVGVFKTHNPALTPRTSSLYQHSIHDGIAPLGFEPEGRSGSPQCGDINSPPNYLKWARNLPSLLADPDGVELFRQYLLQEGKSHSDALDFWFACEGLHKQTDPERLSQFVKVIYRRFFLKTQLGISESHRKAVHKRLKDTNTPLDNKVFDAAQAQIERLITETTYPNFLKSDLYLNHVQSMQNGSLGCSAGSSGTDSNNGVNPPMLATLHEDQELDTNSKQTAFAPLTKDMLIFTQKRRSVETSKPEVFAGMYLYPGKTGAGRAYSSYNPVSRQDSELQSLSSDARTESDNMSLTDSSVDGMSMGGRHRMTRRQYQSHCRQVKESANLNRDPYMHHTVIPRTQRMQKEQVHPMKPERFAAILIEKLESVKRSQEVQEKLAHKLFENENDGAPSAKALADAIRERFQVDDDNDQDILDQHVSRVWNDQTPSRTPGMSSPRPKSPDALRRNRPSCQPINKLTVSGGGSAMAPMSFAQSPYTVPHPYQSRPYTTRHVRKDKDIFSTFSSDSGNVHDFPESLDHHKMHLPKSKSMPDYAETSDTYSSLPSHDGRFRSSREWFGSGRKHSKKPELTDSGVSVVSESVSSHSAQQSNKESRVMTWLLENDKTSCCSHSERDSERASSCSGGSRFDGGKHHSRPNPIRGRRSPPAGPAQPFVADPCMPPLPSPHTPTQLDEARRRLEDQARCKQRQRCSQTGKTEPPASGNSTLRKPKSSEGYTTVVFSFCDEQFPYRTKIPGQSVTLKQFKEFLPKKGNYRYFFKTECEDLDVKVIQEEITDDSEILPLWEGKVMAQVKPLE